MTDRLFISGSPHWQQIKARRNWKEVAENGLTFLIRDKMCWKSEGYLNQIRKIRHLFTYVCIYSIACLWLIFLSLCTYIYISDTLLITWQHSDNILTTSKPEYVTDVGSMPMTKNFVDYEIVFEHQKLPTLPFSFNARIPCFWVCLPILGEHWIVTDLDLILLHGSFE